MKIRLPLVIFLCSAVFFSYSQNCGSDVLHKIRFDTDSAYRNQALASEKTTKEVRQRYQMARIVGAYYNMQATIYTIPVVVHLLHTGGAIGTDYNPTDAQVEATIAHLNSIYNGTLPGVEGAGDIGIQFVLATRDPDGNSTNGIHRVDFSGVGTYAAYGVRLQTTNGVPDTTLKRVARWDPGLFYNIYVVNKIDGEDGTSGGPFVAGYAQYPNLIQPTDGTVMLWHQLAPNRKTLPHELGHALGLAHPFFDPSNATCPPDSDLANTGDQIADTDPISIPAFVARTGTNTCTTNPVRNYHINTEHNFMNYTDVFTLFTPDQRDAMLASMNFPGRTSLRSSWAKRTTYPYTFTSPAAVTCFPAVNPISVAGNASGVIGVTVNDRVFSSSTPFYDGGFLNKAGSALHLVPLAVNASYPISTILYTAVNYHQVSIWIDYNNDGNFDNGTERIMYAVEVPPNGGLTGLAVPPFTVPASAQANTILRMRVTNDVSTRYGPGYIIGGGCYAPVYGQIEDYPVFISSILPVSWKYFKGQKNGNNSWLQWATNTDAHNKLFDIERSSDGVSYEKIGTVANVASGVYSFVDSKATQPLYFYRLRQVDQSDKATYSSVVILRYEANDDQGLRVTNPFNKTIDISLQKAFTTTTQVELVDINGRKLIEGQMTAGQLVMKLETGGNLPSGIYLLKFKSGNTVITKKLVR